MNYNESSNSLPSLFPATVLVFDLEKHSTKSQSDVLDIQCKIENLISKSLQSVPIEYIDKKYTGDGYILTFYNSSCVKIVYFLHYFIPKLKEEMQELSQNFRMGIDFGFINRELNKITGSYEYFNLPIINASRLENSAGQNEIICTELFRDLFYPQYPSMFSSRKKNIETKDRVISSYSIKIMDINIVKEYIRHFLNEKFEVLPSNTGKLILVIEDEPEAGNLIEDAGKMLGYQVIKVSDGKEALRLIEEKEFCLIVTDIFMPLLNGIEVMNELKKMSFNIPTIVISGYGTYDIIIESFRAGAKAYIEKPVEIQKLYSIANTLLNYPSIDEPLRLLCKQDNEFNYFLHKLSETLGAIKKNFKESVDQLSEMFKHKVGNSLSELVEYILPGVNITNKIEVTNTYLEKILKFLECTSLDENELENHLIDIISDYENMYDTATIIHDIKMNNLKESEFKNKKIIVMIMVELIDNAIDSIVEDGRIEISISVIKTKKLLKIVVKDNGHGIENEKVVNWFKKGYSTKGERRGNGLPIVKSILESMKGSIEIKNRQSGGVEAKAFIPIY